MPDLHGWITQQIDAVEQLARAQENSLWQTALGEDSVAAAMLRRCEADRRILNRHRLNPTAYWADAAMCEGCGDEGEMGYPRTENLNDCPELLDLAHAHGITEEILASLDRPAEGERPERTGPSLIPDAIAEALTGRLFATFLGTRTIEARPEGKALKILEPELRKIPSYVPEAQHGDG